MLLVLIVTVLYYLVVLTDFSRTRIGQLFESREGLTLRGLGSNGDADADKPSPS